MTGGSIEESNPNHEANSPPRHRLLDRHLIQRLLACWDGRPGLIIVEPERNLFIHSFFEPSTEENFCLDLSFDARILDFLSCARIENITR